MSGEDVSCR